MIRGKGKVLIKAKLYRTIVISSRHRCDSNVTMAGGSSQIQIKLQTMLLSSPNGDSIMTVGADRRYTSTVVSSRTPQKQNNYTVVSLLNPHSAWPSLEGSKSMATWSNKRNV